MKIPVCLLLLVVGLNSLAQNKTLSGYVIDLANGEVLIGAHVVDQKSGNGTISNSYGFYSLPLDHTDSLHIKVGYLGYQGLDTVFTFNSSNRPFNFKLAPGVNEISGVTIRATKRITESDEINTLKLSVKEIGRLPMIGSEVDILKPFQLMPGVQSGKEGSSGLIVRGGSSDQNLIILDDVPLYYVNHLAGFLSVFNPDAVNTVKMYTAGFPARYGGRLSSVLEIQTKSGNNKKIKGTVNLGIIASKIMIEGPIKRDSSSYLISFRRFIPDLFVKPLMNFNKEFKGGYSFYDVNAKLSWLKKKNKYYFTFYNGADQFSTDYRSKTESALSASSKIRWSNTMGSFRWNQILSSSLYGTLVSYCTNYKYSSSSSFNPGENASLLVNEYESGVTDFGLKYDLDHKIGRNYSINYGAGMIYHIFTPGLRRYQSGINGTDELIQNNEKTFGLENFLYCENHVTLFKKMAANLGLRLVSYNVNQKNYFSVEPRVNINYSIFPDLSLKASYTRMNQYIHLLTNSGLGLPTDLWMPATNKIPPQASEQVSLSIAYIPIASLEFTMEAYYKTMDNLITLKEGVLFFSDPASWQTKVEKNGSGYSKGLEFQVRKHDGKLTGWITYTLAKTEVRFTSLNYGDFYPFKYDRRHAINFVLMYQLTKKLDLSCTWVYGSGYPVTLPYEAQQIIDLSTGSISTSEVFVYDQKNNFRMRDYHRLDIGLSYRKAKKKGTAIWNFSIYNAYNRKNSYYYSTRTDYGESMETTRLYQYSLFPILPSLSYTFCF